METLLYFFKSSIILAIFYGVYYLFMRKNTLFAAKRFFFITGVLTALVLPFLKISKTIYIEAPVFTPTPVLDQLSFNDVEMISTAVAATPVSTPIDWWQVTLIFYVLIAAVLTLRFLIQLFTLFLLFKKTPSQRREGYKYIEVNDAMSPFSFFNYIVYNPQLHSQEELQMILAHEQIHGKQLHSVDMFLSQLITILQWANPFSWLYKKALEANLEFVADAHTITKISSKKQYQLTLVKASSSLTAPALTSPFYQSLIKKRILMLNKTTTHKRNLVKMTFVLPLLAFFFLSFNVKEEIAYKEAAVINKTSSLIITSETLETEINTIEKAINKRTDAFKINFTDVQRDATGKITQLAIKTRFGNQKSFIKNVTYGGEHTEIPAIKLAVKENQLEFSDLEETTVMRVTDSGVKALTFPKNESVATTNDKMGDNPLYIINGKEMLKSELPANSYFEVSESIQMIKPKEATAIYGSKAKDGVYVFNGTTTFYEDDSVSTTKTNQISNTLTAVNAVTVTKTNQVNGSFYRAFFKYLITKNTTDAAFEEMKSELKSKYNTVFEYSVNRNSNNEIISLTMTHNDDKGNSGSYNINDNSPIKDITFYKTDTGFGFVQLKEGQTHEGLAETRRAVMESRIATMEAKNSIRREKLDEKRETVNGESSGVKRKK